MSSGQKVIWFTGLSGSGKSTLAILLAQYFNENLWPVQVLDGDRVRQKKGNQDFSREARIIHNKSLVDEVIVESFEGYVIIATIAPFQEIRDYARMKFDQYFEIYLSTPIEVCEQRDPKNLYSLARLGKIKNFTGIDQVYEKPRQADLSIDTSNQSLDKSMGFILDALSKHGFIDG